MNRRGLLTSIAGAATAALLPVATATPAAATRATVAGGAPATKPTTPAGRARLPHDQWTLLPCPPWCEEDHGPHAWKDDLEESCQERWHTACLGYGASVCVELTRTDCVVTGTTSGERVNVGADCELGADDVLLVARILVASADILAGRLTVAQWRSRSGVDHH